MKTITYKFLISNSILLSYIIILLLQLFFLVFEATLKVLYENKYLTKKKKNENIKYYSLENISIKLLLFFAYDGPAYRRKMMNGYVRQKHFFMLWFKTDFVKWELQCRISFFDFKWKFEFQKTIFIFQFWLLNRKTKNEKKIFLNPCTIRAPKVSFYFLT